MITVILFVLLHVIAVNCQDPSVVIAYQDPSAAIAYRDPSVVIAYQDPSAAVAYRDPSAVIAYQAPAYQYQEAVAPKHGGDGGGPSQFVCPNDGVITGINVRSGLYVDNVQFTCTSPRGEQTTFGGYGGGGGGGPNADNCPPGSYISSIYGRSGLYVDRLGIRCRRWDDMTSPGLATNNGWGGGGGGPYDDAAYSIGFRPVSISIRSGIYLDAIQITYGNKPVILGDRNRDRVEIVQVPVYQNQNPFFKKK